MTLVAGVDSSTQSCKVVVRDADDRRAGPPGPRPAPRRHRGRPGRVGAGAAGGARGGGRARRRRGRRRRRRSSTAWSCLDEAGSVVRPALLWNDTRSAQARRGPRRGAGARRRGPTRWAASPSRRSPWPSCAGSPSTSRTTPPRTAAVCLPHDWLTWRLGRARRRPAWTDRCVTDRSDASGTGYWSPASPASTGPTCWTRPRPGGRRAAPGARHRRSRPARRRAAQVLGPGAGDNAAAALGLGAEPGDVIVSIGTSGVACAVERGPDRGPDRHRRRLRRRHRRAPAAGVHAQRGAGARRDRPAARRRPRPARRAGADRAGGRRRAGARALPRRASGRRTGRTRPARCTGSRSPPRTGEHLARAAVEGLLCGLADAVDALERAGVPVEPDAS